MKSSLRFGVLLVLILLVGAVVNAWSYLGEAHVERKALKDFPQTIGDWQRTGRCGARQAANAKCLPLWTLRECAKHWRVTGGVRRSVKFCRKAKTSYYNGGMIGMWRSARPTHQ